MTLSFVDPKAPPAQNILLYGPPKVGKTVGALSAPGPILLLNAEGGDAALKGRQLHPDTEIREVAYDGRATLNEVYRYLRDGNGVRTFVLDSIGEVYAKLLEEVTNGGQRRAKGDDYGDVNTILERFVRSVKLLPVNVVVIAHEKIEDAEGERIVRPATGGQQLPEKLMAMVSIIGYCGVVPPPDEDTPALYVAQLVEGKGRRAGSRWQEELGASREVDISDWLTVINGAYASAGQTADAPAAEEKPKQRRSRAKAKAEANGNGNGAQAADEQRELATA